MLQTKSTPLPTRFLIDMKTDMKTDMKFDGFFSLLGVASEFRSIMEKDFTESAVTLPEMPSFSGNAGSGDFQLSIDVASVLCKGVAGRQYCQAAAKIVSVSVPITKTCGILLRLLAHIRENHSWNAPCCHGRKAAKNRNPAACFIYYHKSQTKEVRMDKKIKISVIGCGRRARIMVNKILEVSESKAEITTIFDPNPEQMKWMKAHWNTPDAIECSTYQEALDAPGVEWALVCSPNSLHREHVCYAFAAGKHVFCEKPLATTLEDCVAMDEAHRNSGLFFMTGFVLRYSQMYRKIKELLEGGEVGKLLSIDGNENIPPPHGSYIMSCWRRYNKLSGGHLLEKCCHDIDLLNWFADSLPSKVAGFGSLDFYKPENECYMQKYGEKMFTSMNDKSCVFNPFTSEKDIKDTYVAILKYRNGVKVQFQATMVNARPERRMHLCCTDGTITVEIYSSTLRWKKLGEEDEHIIDYGTDHHGGGDRHIAEEWWNCMANGVMPKSGGDEGINSAATVLLIERAVSEEQVIDCEVLWKQLNR